MHLRKLTFTVGLVGAMCTTWAYGLGLGEITLKSTLNQPLDAEIKLLQVRNLTEEEILVDLAKAEDFQRFGVDRIFFLQNLDFDVNLDHPGGPVVRVTTDEPVREPYLIFLLEAQSPAGGRLLREYTLLMDLPVFAEDAAAQPVQGAQAGPAPREQAQAPRAAPQPEPIRPAQPEQRQGEPPRAQPAPARRVAPEPGVEVYGPVQANDTLWEIAERVRPGTGVTMQQTMLALQRTNPDAFINGNINLLKSGQVLRIPSESEFQALDAQSAVSEVAYQNSQWSAARDGQTAGAELDASSSRAPVQTRDEGRRGQLTLAAPGQADQAGERSGAGDSSATTEALENELAITSEELDAARRENQELSTRVADLEEQIATMERLLEVSSEELRTMQLAAEQNREQQEGDPADGETTPADAEQEATAEQGGDEVDSAESAAAADDTAAEEQAAPEEQAAEAAPEPVAQPINTVVPQIPPQPTVMDMVMANLWYILVAVLALLGGLVYFLHRRSQAAEMAAFEALDHDDFDHFDEDGDDFSLEESGGFDEDVNFSAEDPLNSQEEFEETEEPVEAETGDAVGEADIYIAYGKFEQAEEMLQKAIVQEPNHIEARLKLLEVYSETKDIDKFDREYGHLLSLGDGAASARAGELRAGIPGAAPYVGDLEAAPSAGASSESEGSLGSNDDLSFNDGDMDLGDLSLDDHSASGNTESEEEPLLTLDSTVAEDSGSDDLGELSFDLDGDAGELSFDLDEAGADAGSKAQEASAGEMNFDFDLDLSDDAEAESPGSAGKEPESDEFDLGDDFSFTATEGDDELDLSFEADGADAKESAAAEQASDESGLDFSLELDELSLDAEESDIPSLDTKVEGESGEEPELEFSLDTEADDSDELLNLDLGGSADQADDEVGDIFSDMEFGSESLDDAMNLGGEQPAAAPSAEAAAPAVGDDGDDAFDMDLDDLDLKALDQEMDALVGGVDDDFDDDLAVAAPPKAAAAPATEPSTDSALNMGGLSTGGEAEEQEELFNFDSNEFGEDQDLGVEEDLDSELGFLSDADEVATKLDLARAYIDMGDQDGAKDILEEVSSEGSDDQKREAAELLEKID
ncbi:FimV/HubP family polar landmark protein [Gilvimarinus sp. F26214L]|uniref:FimV/HubP family polar landmark protein n=1 Tax=Gilvimarinus sp. DZF01 TaxID=3461371 RepID=UPI0040466801